MRAVVKREDGVQADSITHTPPRFVRYEMPGAQL